MSLRISLTAAVVVSAAAVMSSAPAQAGCFDARCHVKSYAHYNQPTYWTSYHAPVVYHRVVHRPAKVRTYTTWQPVTRVVPVTTYQAVTTWRPVTTSVVYHSAPFYHYGY